MSSEIILYQTDDGTTEIQLKAISTCKEFLQVGKDDSADDAAGDIPILLHRKLVNSVPTGIGGTQ